MYTSQQFQADKVTVLHVQDAQLINNPKILKMKKKKA
jgi:hypothetical protein